MSDLRNKPTEELEALVDDAAAALAEIKEELQRRKQRAEIDQLDHHMEEARPKWSEIREFFGLVIEELRRK